MKDYLAACPGWLGGKRAIAPQIMRVIAGQGAPPGAILADAFSGGGAVSVAAKVLGYQVAANDMSPLAEATAKALVENSDWTLSSVAATQAIQAEPNGVELPDEKLLSIPDNCRELLAGMASVEREAKGWHRWLMRAWITKTALSMATWGMPTMGAGRREWDELTPGQATQLRRTGKPRALAIRIAEAINRAVFHNGRDNTAHRGDAVSFITGVQADVLYLDPPYPGTLSYEDSYAGVAKLLEPDYDASPSEWSEADGWRLLEDVFDAGEHIDLWVVSMGKGADAEAIQTMITDRGREAEMRTLDHEHLKSLKKEHGEGGDELLIVGKR